MTELSYSLQIEAGIIGCLVLHPELLNRLSFLACHHFHSDTHAKLFQKICLMYAAGESITPFTVIPEASAVESLKEAGGVPVYLRSAISLSNIIINPEQEAKTLVAMSEKRDFVKICQTAIEKASSESDSGSVAEHAASLGAHLEGVLKRCGMKDIQDDYEVIEEILRDMADNRQPFSTGFPKLDAAMGGGLYPGKSYGFAARKKVGKTIKASTISCNLATNGIKHLFVCGEMGPKEIHQRNLSRLTGFYPSRFREPDNDNLKRKIAEIARTSNRCILYHNAPGLLFDDLKRVASGAVFRHNIKGMILDYWQLVGGKSKGQSTAEHLDEVSQWIADFGRKHGIFTITMAQLNQDNNTRGGEGMRLAFDQVYAIRGMGENEDITQAGRWLEMLETRYTKWANIGDKNNPGFLINDFGPHFEAI